MHNILQRAAESKLEIQVRVPGLDARRDPDLSVSAAGTTGKPGPVQNRRFPTTGKIAG